MFLLQFRSLSSPSISTNLTTTYFALQIKLLSSPQNDSSFFMGRSFVFPVYRPKGSSVFTSLVMNESERVSMSN